MGSCKGISAGAPGRPPAPTPCPLGDLFREATGRSREGLIKGELTVARGPGYKEQLGKQAVEEERKQLGEIRKERVRAGGC